MLYEVNALHKEQDTTLMVVYIGVFEEGKTAQTAALQYLSDFEELEVEVEICRLTPTREVLRVYRTKESRKWLN